MQNIDARVLGKNGFQGKILVAKKLENEPLTQIVIEKRCENVDGIKLFDATQLIKFQSFDEPKMYTFHIIFRWFKRRISQMTNTMGSSRIIQPDIVNAILASS